jgi:hypothetical protein
VGDVRIIPSIRYLPAAVTDFQIPTGYKLISLAQVAEVDHELTASKEGGPVVPINAAQPHPAFVLGTSSCFSVSKIF